MAGKVLATDLDGTLFFPKSQIQMIPRKNRRFLKKWIQDGNRLVLVTSRGHEFMDHMKKKFPDIPFDIVGGDGTFVQIGDQIVKEEYFEAEPFRRFLKELESDYEPGLLMTSSKDCGIIQRRSHNHGLANFFYVIYQLYQGTYRESRVKDDQVFYGEIEKGRTYKLMACIGLTKTKQRLAYHLTNLFTKEYPDFEFAWLNQFIEVTPKGCDKSSGLSFYLDYLGIPKENVSVIGDSGNDAPMFEAFYENSYCMAHSHRLVKQKAKHVVSSVADLEAYLYPSADR